MAGIFGDYGVVGRRRMLPAALSVKPSINDTYRWHCAALLRWRYHGS